MEKVRWLLGRVVLSCLCEGCSVASCSASCAQLTSLANQSVRQSPHLRTVQAVAKGDAAAVAKKAADDARAAQEAQVDALFASDEEDEDYNPEASRCCLCIPA